jgi:hypothetical protein
MSGRVVSAFLKANAMSHAVIIHVDPAEIDHLKVIVATGGSRQNAPEFRWPFGGDTVKFASKINLQNDFEPIYDAVTDGDLSAGDIESGKMVTINYTPYFYSAKPAKSSDNDYGPGLSLRLNAIAVNRDQQLSFESPSKRRRVGQSEVDGMS